MSAFVSLAKHDVFITYPMASYKWAEYFEHDLREELEQFLPSSELKIYLAEHNQFAPSRDADEAERSVLLIAVFESPVLSVGGDRCFRREWEGFCRSPREFGPVGTRFMTVSLEETDHQSMNQFFELVRDDRLSQRFEFQFKAKAGISHDLVRGSYIYRTKTVEIAAYINWRLHQIKGQLN